MFRPQDTTPGPSTPPQPQPGSNDSSEPGSSKSDKDYKPDSQDVQTDRVKDLNGLLENNNKKERFAFRNEKPIDDYPRQKIGEQMKLLASGHSAQYDNKCYITHVVFDR